MSMPSDRQQRRRLERLAAAVPHLQLVITQREGDVVAAHPADRRDLEVVAAGKGYDIWVRPKGPIIEERFPVGKSVAIMDRGLEPARFGLTLGQAARALHDGSLRPVRNEIWEVVTDYVKAGGRAP